VEKVLPIDTPAPPSLSVNFCVLQLLKSVQEVVSMMSVSSQSYIPY